MFQKSRTTAVPEAARHHKPEKEEPINERYVNRTLVRAKMRVVEIRKHLRRKMKKAS